MKSIFGVAIAASALAAGCSSPLSQSWDDPVSRSIRARFQAADLQRAAGAVPPDNPAIEIESLGSLSVDDAIRIGIANTPGLRRAGYRVDIAAGRVLQAGLYPNPSFAFDAEGLGADAGAGGETIYRVEQEIVLGGKLGKARAVAEADRLAAQAGFVAEEFDVAARVSNAYFAAVAARERQQSRQEMLDLSRRLFEAVSAQVEAGSATEADRLRAEVVREQAEIEFETARLDATTARRLLGTVIGMEGPVTLALSTPPDELPSFPDRDSILAMALETNSRVSLAKIAIERAGRAHELAKAEAVPNLIASIGPRFSDIDNETTLDIGLGVEIPLFDRNQGNIHAALAERLSSAAQLREVQLQLIGEVGEAWAAYESARLTIGRYREQLLPKADRTLDLTRQAYERGKVGYLRLLDAQQVVIESNIAYINALARLQRSAALLRQLAQTEAPWRDAAAETGSLPEDTP
ncbi:MAG: TolC family protein [Planctomycetota bacterium]|nr:TolC family protein [Planctomycetota bacterium]